MLSRPSSRSQPLPEKISLLLQEARWLILGVMSLYVGLILVGYSEADPGWSHASDVARVSNPGGRFGAWLADLLLYLFGVSSWWWVVFLGYSLLWGFRRLKNQLELDRRSFIFVMIGFLVVLITSSALEFLRFHSHGAALPLEPGGLIGMELAQFTRRYFGFTGGTLILLALLASGLSLFTGVSWLAVMEGIGQWFEQGVLGVQQAWLRWQDRRVGREIAQKREEVVQTRRKKVEKAEAAPPLRIEPAVVAVVKSERVEKERQQTLFADAPEGVIPPVGLLDPASGGVEPPSPESLEFTSRVIETKLADFGVEVKVLAAYPGPVITRYEIEPATGEIGRASCRERV